MKSKIWLVHLRDEQVPRRVVLDEEVTRQHLRPHLLKALGMDRMPRKANIYVPLDEDMEGEDD